MKSTVRIAAIILNYKTPQLTLSAVRSLYTELDPDKDAIYVVDNCSGDGSYEFLKNELAIETWSGRIEVLISERNGGFSYGNNFAMARVNADAYLLLNSDAEIKQGAVNEMWSALQLDQNIGLVGPLVVDQTGEAQVSCFVDRTPWNEFLTAAKTGPITKLFGWFGVRELVIQPGGAAREVDWLSFVCVLIRGETVQDIGPMDDGYFMYREDNDYSRRARINRWKVHYLTNATVMHLNKGWSGKEMSRQPKFFYESRTRYYRKYYGLFGFVLTNLLWIVGRLIHLLREWFQGLPPSVAQSAWRDIWTFSVGEKPLPR